MTKIAITTSSFVKEDDAPLRLLKDNGFKLSLNPYGRKLKKEEVSVVCNGAIGIIAGTETLDSCVMEQLSGLKVISRCGTGMDNVDAEAAVRLGIKVFNTPDAPTLAVAELTVGFILNLLRKVGCMDSSVRAGKWEKLMGNLLRNKSVGIIGFGRIGRKTADMLNALGCTVRFYDVREDLKADGYEKVEFDELLNKSDIVSIHVSSNYRILGQREIGIMKKGSWLINVARGGVIDEAALYNSLKIGHLAGAALDVFEKEPYSGPLTELENVMLTPHIGSYAVEARIEMETQAALNLLRGLGIESQ